MTQQTKKVRKEFNIIRGRGFVAYINKMVDEVILSTRVKSGEELSKKEGD